MAQVDDEFARAAQVPSAAGHRERLRKRLLSGGAEALADYEVLESLLFAANRRGDTKPLAKALLARFGSLARVLEAEPAALAKTPGMGEAGAAALKAVALAARRMARTSRHLSPAPHSIERLESAGSRLSARGWRPAEAGNCARRSGSIRRSVQQARQARSGESKITGAAPHS